MLMKPPVSHNSLNSNEITQCKGKEVQTKVILVAADGLLEAMSTRIKTYNIEAKSNKCQPLSSRSNTDNRAVDTNWNDGFEDDAKEAQEAFGMGSSNLSSEC